MPAIQKNKQESIRNKKSARATSLLLPHNERESKKLAEMNAILEKMIFLPEETDVLPDKKLQRINKKRIKKA
jgi:hypothetical protein